MARWGIAAMQAGTDTVLDGIMSGDLPLNPEIRKDTADGEVYAREVYKVAENPVRNFSTRAIAKTIDALVNADGDYFKSITDMTGDVFNIFTRQWQDGGARAAGAAHRKFILRKGIFAPVTLSANGTNDAELSCQIGIAYDGTNPIVDIVDSQSLPALGTEERFALAGVVLNGKDMGAMAALSVDFGFTLSPERSGSDIWPTEMYVSAGDQKITGKTKTATAFGAAQIPIGGLIVAHANTTLYLRKRAAGAAFVANNVAEHIKITVSGTVFIDNCVDASGNETGETSFMIECDNDGTNRPIVFDTSIAIT